MKKKLALPLILIILTLLAGCETYTARSAKETIQIPEPVASESLETKYSVLEAKNQAVVEAAQEKSLLEKYEMAIQDIADLQKEKSDLQAMLEENQASLADSEQKRTELTQSLADTTAALESLQTSYDQLSARAVEIATELQDTKESLATYEDANIEQLKAKIESLQTENEGFKAQEEQAVQAKEEQAQLELQRQAELQAEYQQIPSLDKLTFPRLYKTSESIILAGETDQLRALMLPLDDGVWTDEAMAHQVASSIADLDYPVIFVTGNLQNVIALVKELRRNAVLVEGGAILTKYEVVSSNTHSASVKFSKTKTIRLALADLPEYEVFSSFSGGGNWQEVQKSISKPREATLNSIISEAAITEPTLIGASLYEPSYQDWNSFSPIEYRQIDYIWPLSNMLEEKGFYDTYRLTHFSSDTDAGNTFIKGDLKERVDYLYSRKILPMSSSMLTIGGESVEDSMGIARYGISATYLIP